MASEPQIVRIWSGTTNTVVAGEYQEYLIETGLPGYSRTPGNKAAYFTSRVRGDLTEFCLITIWESMSAIREFAGDQPEQAVFYPQDETYLVDRDLTVTHYDVFAASPMP